MTYIEKGYYFDDFTINDDELPVFKKCYENCKTCNNKMIDNEMNCLLCKDNYYKIYGENNNCYNEDLLNKAKLYGYYYNSTYWKFTKCDKACLSCNSGPNNDNTNCIKCNEEKGFYPIYNNNSLCFNNKTIKEGYFLNKTIEPYIWKKCYENWAISESQGNEAQMFCLSCKTNLISKKFNKICILNYQKEIVLKVVQTIYFWQIMETV